MPHGKCHILHVTCYLSYITCEKLHVKSQMLHATKHLEYVQMNELGRYTCTVTQYGKEEGYSRKHCFVKEADNIETFN